MQFGCSWMKEMIQNDFWVFSPANEVDQVVIQEDSKEERGSDFEGNVFTTVHLKCP